MSRLLCLLIIVAATRALSADDVVLFDGSHTDHWEFAEGAWVIEGGALTCRMETVKDKKGNERVRGMGYAWTKKDYQDFELQFAYRLSESANSGVFFRTDPKNPVQGGFEVQLLDNEGFQKVKGKKDPKNLNGAFYDCQAAAMDSAKPVGEWNRMKLTVKGALGRIEINGQVINEFDIDQWDTPQKNPDGSNNKFKRALRELPRSGRIGFQNHGQVVWFKDIKIRSLE